MKQKRNLNTKPKRREIVLIFSIDGDLSTDYVMDWLLYFGYRCYRYNVDSKDKLTSSFTIKFSNKNDSSNIIIDGEKLNIKDIISVWFRKFFNPNFKNILAFNQQEYSVTEIYQYLKSEYSTSMHSLFRLLIKKNKCLGGRITKQPTKMEMLQKAKLFGIDIPNTLITSDKLELTEFIIENKEVVTKSIKDGNMFVKVNLDNSRTFASIYTELVDTSKLDKIPNNFFPSLFQEKLDKEIEIRSFFLDGKFYSSAIFSQLDEQTSLDFRMYNNLKPNRIIPYKLSKKIESKLAMLMDSLDLKCGSLDLVKTKEGKTFFLEVNPWGQYDMISQPCNYFLDKKIAQYLIKSSK